MNNRRPSSISQERATVRMEPVKASSPKLVLSPPSKPSVAVEEQTEPRELEIPPPPAPVAPEEPASSKTWWILGAVAVALLGLLAVILLT